MIRSLKYKLLIILLFLSTPAFAQLGQQRIRLDTGVAFTPGHYVFMRDSLAVGKQIRMDSMGIPVQHPNGSLHLFSRALAGLFVQYANGNVRRLDTNYTGIFEPVITPSNTVHQYWNGFKQFVTLNTDSITEGAVNLFFTNARARSAISANAPILYNSSTGVISADTTTSVTGLTTLWQNSLKKDKNDTTSGVGYVRNHQLNDSTIQLRADLKRKDDSTDATSGYTTLYQNSLKANKSTTITINGTTNRLTSSAGAQDLSLNRTWTLDISGSYVGQSSITTLGTIGTGTWQGTKVGLAYGGTNADLSLTGGTSNYLKQSSAGAAITVGTIPASDIASAQNLTVGTSLSITSGTGTGATLQALGLNTIQGITTASSPTFAGATLSNMTKGSVLFAGTGGAINQDNANLFYDTTNHALGIGYTNPQVINANTGLLISPPTNRSIEVDIASFGDNAASLRGWTSGGTSFSSLGATSANKVIFDVAGGGYDGSAWARGGIIRFTSDNAWTTGDHSAHMSFFTVATTTTTLSERMRIDNAGNVGIGTTSPTSLFSVGSTSQFQVGSTGNVPSVAGVAGVGKFGVPVVIYTSNGRNIAVDNSTDTISLNAGRYLISYAIMVHTTGTAGSTASILFIWNNTVPATESHSTAVITLTNISTTNHDEGSFLVSHITGGAALKKRLNFSSAGGSPTYDFDVVVQALDQ